jgi:hypothetical protein
MPSLIRDEAVFVNRDRTVSVERFPIPASSTSIRNDSMQL